LFLDVGKSIVVNLDVIFKGGSICNVMALIAYPGLVVVSSKIGAACTFLSLKVEVDIRRCAGDAGYAVDGVWSGGWAIVDWTGV
jgi:hypothetical protein